MNLMIALPLVGVPLIILLQKDYAKYIAFGISLIPLVLSVILYQDYLAASALGNAAVDGNLSGAYNNFVLSSGADSGGWWFSSVTGYDIKFITGLDGISIYLLLLTTFLFPVTFLFSWGSVSKLEKGYYALLLILEVGVLGFFVSLDLIMFYIFFEMVLIPMYFLIGIWGGKERFYASVKFFLYTLVGSLLMLVAIIYMGQAAAYAAGSSFTSDYNAILTAARQGAFAGAEAWLFGAFTISFAIKVPLFPVHTWLPDAHTQAPTAGSVILAGVLLKMGTYGLVRYCLPFFPHASVEFAPLMCGFAVIGIIYGAMAAMVQKDVKKLVAYSSVSHLGFIVLGIFSFNQAALDGAVIQMVNHGIATGALFLIVGMIYDRRHTRMIKDFQGIARKVPIFTLFFMITVLASVGLPGLNGFVGEFLVLMGSFDSGVVSNIWPILAATGVIIAAVYLLWMFRRVMFGKLDKEENQKLVDLNGREILVLTPLVILMFWLGFNSGPWLEEIGASSKNILRDFPTEVEGETSKNNLEVAPEEEAEDLTSMLLTPEYLKQPLPTQ